MTAAGFRGLFVFRRYWQATERGQVALERDVFLAAHIDAIDILSAGFIHAQFVGGFIGRFEPSGGRGWRGCGFHRNSFNFRIGFACGVALC
jgi:hypothetical protein